jgi:hypothetical protein
MKMDMWYKCSKQNKTKKKRYHSKAYDMWVSSSGEYRKKIAVLWDVTPFSFVLGYQRLGETCCFRLHVSQSSFEYFHPRLHFPLAYTVISSLNCQHTASFSSSHNLWLQNSERTLSTQAFAVVLRDIFCKCCSHYKHVATLKVLTTQPEELGTDYILEFEIHGYVLRSMTQ